MKLDFALIADAATVDPSGKINVLGIFDRIRAARFPARHGRLSLALRISLEPGESGKRRAEILLIGPSDQEVLKLDGEMGIEPPRGEGKELRLPQVLNLDGIVFPEPGRYRFELRVERELLGSVGLVLEEGRGMPGGGAQGEARGRPGPDTPPILFRPDGPVEA